MGEISSHVLPKMSLCPLCNDQACLCTTYTVELVLRSIVTTHMYVLPNNVTAVRDEHQSFDNVKLNSKSTRSPFLFSRMRSSLDVFELRREAM